MQDIQTAKSGEAIESEYREVVAAQKNPAHFEPLYNRYHEQIFRFIYRRLDDVDDAADITQQVFTKALAGIAGYKNKGVPFSTWLYRIAINELNSFFKKDQKQRCLDIDSTDLSVLASETAEDSTEEMFASMERGLAELPQREMDFLQMRFFEHRPFREIGDILGMTENNAKVSVYRAIEKLRKIIAGK